MTVRVYVAPGCPHCRALLADLERRKVAVEIVDLGGAPARVAELVAVTWERRLPAVVDHERCSVGFAGRSSSFEELGVRWPLEP